MSVLSFMESKQEWYRGGYAFVSSNAETKVFYLLKRGTKSMKKRHYAVVRGVQSHI